MAFTPTIDRHILTIGLTLMFAAPASVADDQTSAWTFDSNRPEGLQDTSPSVQDDMAVYAMLNKMIGLWNSKDLDGYLDLFWKSDSLLVVEDGLEVLGWNRLRQTYIESYPDRTRMGVVTLQRTKIMQLSPGLSQVLSWWMVDLAGRKSYSTDTTIFRKFTDGWKAISVHASFIQP
jgi:hypothetical protein